MTPVDEAERFYTVERCRLLAKIADATAMLERVAGMVTIGEIRNNIKFIEMVALKPEILTLIDTLKATP